MCSHEKWEKDSNTQKCDTTHAFNDVTFCTTVISSRFQPTHPPLLRLSVPSSSLVPAAQCARGTFLEGLLRRFDYEIPPPRCCSSSGSRLDAAAAVHGRKDPHYDPPPPPPPDM